MQTLLTTKLPLLPITKSRWTSLWSVSWQDGRMHWTRHCTSSWKTQSDTHMTPILKRPDDAAAAALHFKTVKQFFENERDSDEWGTETSSFWNLEGNFWPSALLCSRFFAFEIPDFANTCAATREWEKTGIEDISIFAPSGLDSYPSTKKFSPRQPTSGTTFVLKKRLMNIKNLKVRPSALGGSTGNGC